MKKLTLFGLLLAATACQRSFYVARQQSSRLSVDATVAADSSTLRWLAPYKQQLDATMNAPLVTITERLEKNTPESALDDLLADALLAQAGKKYGKTIDVSHLNYGGIRNGLPAGSVTTGNLFEVMPFDNQLVVLTLTGAQLMQFLNHFAANDNALVVGGVRVRVHDKAVTSATLTNGRTIVPDQSYTVAMSDYVANGGGGADFLKTVGGRDNVNYLIRDALIDYFREQGKAGKPLTPQADGRITLE
ncbi:5'-nucleotidase C-terminal domain-containing protein [Fibrella sp. HMF5335]|uniref:5'-nucleotidase C-terminal domain-containing protein n=1 Tax=Fibrella rubiginis TaxID=2817060 RepID=A0A939GGI0_9BACT|nr:5'-nucleotidase C-terminal domain-containing protein [Fibrella rubiginis]MBO0937921.1 5'-nucleotidase C-terminal domain-containing protein [Fibrella rubiginis]